MGVKINLFSDEKGELNKFLSLFYDTNLEIENKLNWERLYSNPIEIAEIIAAYIDNSDIFSINMWLCLDKDVYIKITEKNADFIIKYLYERFPY